TRERGTGSGCNGNVQRADAAPFVLGRIKPATSHPSAPAQNGRCRLRLRRTDNCMGQQALAVVYFPAAYWALISLGSSPPMRHTSFHSAAVTGCTDSRVEFTSAMFRSFGFSLMAASVTGFGMSATALTSTHSHVPELSFGSGCAKAITSTIPTISLPRFE